MKRLRFFNSRFLERRPESQAASSTRDLVHAGRCLIYRSSPWWHPLRSILCATVACYAWCLMHPQKARWRHMTPPGSISHAVSHAATAWTPRRASHAPLGSLLRNPCWRLLDPVLSASLGQHLTRDFSPLPTAGVLEPKKSAPPLASRGQRLSLHAPGVSSSCVLDRRLCVTCPDQLTRAVRPLLGSRWWYHLDRCLGDGAP